MGRSIRKEFEILTGMEATEDNAYSYARKTGNVVLLKGKVDIITDGKRIIHSPGGNARMTMGGTGIKGKPSADYARIISIMNGSGKPILSIDMPSGFGTEVLENTCEIHFFKIYRIYF